MSKSERIKSAGGKGGLRCPCCVRPGERRYHAKLARRRARALAMREGRAELFRTQEETP